MKIWSPGWITLDLGTGEKLKVFGLEVWKERGSLHWITSNGRVDISENTLKTAALVRRLLVRGSYKPWIFFRSEPHFQKELQDSKFKYPNITTGQKETWKIKISEDCKCSFFFVCETRVILLCPSVHLFFHIFTFPHYSFEKSVSWLVDPSRLLPPAVYWVSGVLGCILLLIAYTTDISLCFHSSTPL